MIAMQVQQFNQLTKQLEGHELYTMRQNTGALWEEERKRGWVVAEIENITGDSRRVKSAKLVANQQEAERIAYHD